jgi:hypothetical protein
MDGGIFKLAIPVSSSSVIALLSGGRVATRKHMHPGLVSSKRCLCCQLLSLMFPNRLQPNRCAYRTTGPASKQVPLVESRRLAVKVMATLPTSHPRSFEKPRLRPDLALLVRVPSRPRPSAAWSTSPSHAPINPVFVLSSLSIFPPSKRNSHTAPSLIVHIINNSRQPQPSPKAFPQPLFPLRLPPNTSHMPPRDLDDACKDEHGFLAKPRTPPAI